MQMGDGVGGGAMTNAEELALKGLRVQWRGRQAAARPVGPRPGDQEECVGQEGGCVAGVDAETRPEARVG